jgi:hypothetical protein
MIGGSVGSRKLSTDPDHRPSWQEERPMADSQSISPIVTYKDIPGFPGYRVGDDGSVWSCRSINGQGFSPGRYPWRRLRLIRRHKDGYYVVTIRNQFGKLQVMIHRLVLEVFVGPCPLGMVACHFPARDISNNCLNNLRWDTYESNEADKLVHGTRPVGSRQPRSKLTEADIPLIRQAAEQGISQTEIARMFGVTRCPIHAILIGKAWRHVAPVERPAREEALPLFAGEGED